MAIRQIGVLGAGLMGSGIAQVAAASGYGVTIVEVSDELIQKGLGGIEKSLAKFAEKGTLTAAQKDETMARLRGTTRLEELSDADLIIEAIIENPAIKKETFQKLDGLCKPEAIFASNTSSLSITELMTAVSPARRERFIGLHFFNPVPLMKLLEVVRTIVTDETVYEEAVKTGEAMGKTVVRTGDSTGFIVNRLLVPYLLDAIRAFEGGLGTITDIDNAMKLGCGYPMGPLTLSDFVGLDTLCHIGDIMFDEFRQERFAPPPLLRRLVLAGMYGRKSGRGFYDYSDPKNPQPVKLI
jgi:3-hydroxybutyryl-CoA dehydrogenase